MYTLRNRDYSVPKISCLCVVLWWDENFEVSEGSEQTSDGSHMSLTAPLM